MIGTWIGPYKIVRELPQDRVGRVYEAVDATGKKHYQIKSLRPEVAGEPVLVTRLYTEAQTLALLNHEHIARLFGFIRRDDGIYLVMEFVEGENLKEILRCKGRLDSAVALAFFRQIQTILSMCWAARRALGFEAGGSSTKTTRFSIDSSRDKVLRQSSRKFKFQT